MLSERALNGFITSATRQMREMANAQRVVTGRIATDGAIMARWRDFT